MSLLIRVFIVVLLALLAIGAALLVLVCWALAACASRRDYYLEKDYQDKKLSGEVEEVSAWALGVSDQFVHYFAIEV